MANADQIRNWDGPAGEHWVREMARYDAMVEPFGRRLLDAAAPRPGERALDVGCGTGALAAELAGLVGPSGEVTGLDVSGPMLAAARERAPGVTFVQGDAQTHPLPRAAYDLVVSRFGLMFFDDPAAAFANLGGTLAPGGRLAFVCWQDLLRNDWIMVPATAALEHVPVPPLTDRAGPGPFSLADPDLVRRLVTGAGLVDVAVDEVRAPMRMGVSVDDTVAFYRRTEIASEMIERASPAAQARAWGAVTAAVAAAAGDAGVAFDGVAWLVTARAPA